MGADVNCLMGEIIEDPANTDRNVEQLLAGLLHALLKEQSVLKTRSKPEVAHDATSTR